MLKNLKKYGLRHWQDLLFISLAVWLFAPVLFSGGTKLLDDSDDPARNYFTNGWVIKNQSGLWDCEGFNYPYGENIFYLDCNPLFLIITKSITTVLPFLKSHWLFILHSLYAFSFALAGMLYYRVFRQWGAHMLIACISAFCMIGLSPQLFRLGGHLGLGIMCFFPALILLFHPGKKKIIHYIFILLASCASALCHPYLGAITGGTFILTGIFGIAFSGFRIRNGETKIFLLKTASVIAGIVIFYALMHFSDHHPERTPVVRTLEDYSGSWKGLFTTYQGYFIKDFFLIGNHKIPYEGAVYPGIFALLLAVPAIILLVACIRKTTPDQVFMRSFLLASFCLYIFATGYLAYTFPGYFDNRIIRQFRVTARFSWPAAYAILLLSGWFVAWFHKKFPGKIVTVILCVLFILPVTEAVYHIRDLRKQFGDHNFLNVETPAITDEQFLLPVPWFSMGSDLLYKQGEREAVLKTYGASYSSGLPMTGGHLIRSSVSETADWINGLSQVKGASFVPGKALLFITGAPQTLPEETWMRSSVETELSAFRRVDFSTTPSLPLQAYAYTDYEYLTTNFTGRTGKGNSAPPMGFENALPAENEWLKISAPWYIRFWYYSKDLHGRDNALLVVNKNGDWLQVILCSQIVEVQGEWALVDAMITGVPAPGDSVKLVLHNFSKPEKPVDFIIDDLEILTEKTDL